jgi:DNA (cytosine-5)-methyltransferase 1
VAENVKGLLLGAAKEYVIKIYKAFDEAGYYCQHFLLDASKMGVPQRRERVFFICLRKDLASKFLYWQDMFTEIPKIEMEFNEKEILFGEVDEQTDNIQDANTTTTALKYWHLTEPGQSFSTVADGSFFNWIRLSSEKVANTIPAQTNYTYHSKICRPLNKSEYCLIGSYPKDYKFNDLKPVYLIGMSVPPVMTAQIASNIYEQWLNKL